MTKRHGAIAAPAPLEDYALPFDAAFSKLNQQEGFRCYLEGLLLPSERNKTLTGLANTEPSVGAQQARAQGLQWFLSESNWQEREIQNRRLSALLEEVNRLSAFPQHPIVGGTRHGPTLDNILFEMIYRSSSL